MKPQLTTSVVFETNMEIGSSYVKIFGQFLKISHQSFGILPFLKCSLLSCLAWHCIMCTITFHM